MMFSNCPAIRVSQKKNEKKSLMISNKLARCKIEGKNCQSKTFLIKVQLTDLAHFHAAHLGWVYTTTAYWPR